MTDTIHEVKVCRKCELPKDAATDFPRRSWVCKSCTATRVSEWVTKNRDRSNTIKRAYAERHPDRYLAAKTKHYEANKEEIKRRSQAFKDQNREHVRSNYKKQYAANPTPFQLRAARRDAANKLVGGKFTRADFDILWVEQGGLCANPFCEADLLETGYENDHIVPVASKGSHDRANRQLLCPPCNAGKGVLSQEVWLDRQLTKRSANG